MTTHSGTPRLPSPFHRITVSPYHLRALASPLLLVLLYAGACYRYQGQGLLTPGAVFNIIDSAAILGIVAIGMTLAIISGGIDLSVGAVMGLASISAAVLITDHQWPWWAAFGAVIAGAAALGAAQGRIIHATGLAPFIVTLATMFLARGLSFLIHLEPLSITDDAHAAIAAINRKISGARLRIGAIVMLSATLIAAIALRQTRAGRGIYAIGGSDESAALMGLRVGRTRTLVYAASSACAALAGCVLTLQLSSGSHIEGVGMELDAVAAVVIGGASLQGGRGTPLGTLTGTLILALVLTVVTTYGGGSSSGLTKLLVAGLLLGFVLIQRGLTRISTDH
jgi:simple sugar transport system permease protein